MGFTCDICHNKPACTHCFVDKAAMCQGCDRRVHTASKAAQKHERVALTAHKDTTQCDICQEQPAVMFCTEDRALICRRCDIMIHTANQFTQTHHRYILSGFAAGLHTLPEPTSSGGADSSADTTIRRASAAAAMPRIAPSSSSGDLLTLPKMPMGAAMIGGSAAAPPAAASQPEQPLKIVSQPVASAASPPSQQHLQQQPAASSSGAGPSTSAAPSASAGAGGASASAEDRDSGVTLAADLLGMPTLATNYSAKDVDAAWGDAGLGDLDDWSNFLEVPDLGFLPDGIGSDFGFGDAGGASQPVDPTIFDQPVVSVREPGLLGVTATSAPLAQTATKAPPAAGSPKDSLVPEVPSLKRQRME